MSSRKSVLVLGGRGMLGHKMVQVLAQEGSFDIHTTVQELPSTDSQWKNVRYHAGLEFGPHSSTLPDLLSKLKPDFIINAIGAIKQKDLYSEIDNTYYINGTFPHLLALLNPHGKVIHVSTDCVFKGNKGSYVESMLPDSEDLYGRSKAVGEINYGRHLTLRTSIIGFEWSGHRSLLSWLFSNVPHANIKGFASAIYSGLPTVTFSRSVLKIMKESPDLCGLYHIASEPINKFDLLNRMNERFQLKLNIQADNSLVLDRSLDDTIFRNKTKTARPSWDLLVEELWNDFHSQPYADIYSTLVRAKQQ